jgi:hypothetical protein
VATIENNQAIEFYNRNVLYPWMVWITTLLVTGPLSIILDSIFLGQGMSVLPMLFDPTIIFVYLIFSAPTFLVCLLIFYLFTSKKMNAPTIKIVLTVLSILGILTTLAIIGGDERSLQIDYIYSLSAIPPIFLFKIYRKKFITELIRKYEN